MDPEEINKSEEQKKKKKRNQKEKTKKERRIKSESLVSSFEWFYNWKRKNDINFYKFY